MANIFTNGMDWALNKNINKVMQTSYATRTMQEMSNETERQRKLKEEEIDREYLEWEKALNTQKKEIDELESKAKKESLERQKEINEEQQKLLDEIKEIRASAEKEKAAYREAKVGTDEEIDAVFDKETSQKIKTARAVHQEEIDEITLKRNRADATARAEIEEKTGAYTANLEFLKEQTQAAKDKNNLEFDLTKEHLADELAMKDKMMGVIADKAGKMAQDIVKVITQGMDKAAKLVEDYSKAYGGMTGQSYIELAQKNAKVSWDTLNENGFLPVTNALENIQFALDLTAKGWKEDTARSLANDNQIYKKLDPYLDTTSEAFLNIQQRSDGMVEQVAGMGGYLYDIAGSARVWTANANTIITKLNPIQMWAEKSLLNEQAMAAIEELVANSNLTEDQASQIVQTAVSVASDPYASITGGSTVEKIAAVNAINSNDYNLGSIISSIMGTAGRYGSGGNRVSQSAWLTAMGMQNMFSNNADMEETSGNYFKQMDKNTKSTITAQETWGSRLTSFLSGKFQTVKELWENFKDNAGSTLGLLSVCFPMLSSQLGQIASLIVSSIISNAAGDAIDSFGMSVLAAAGTTAGSLAVSGVTGVITSGMINSATKQGYAVGTSYVPYDQVALIHEGEAVLTREQNSSFQKFVQKNGGTVESAISSIEKTEQEEKNDKLISVVREATEQICRVLAYTQGNGNNSKTAESQATKNEYRLVRS